MPYELNGALLAGLKRMNFLEPTPIQRASLYAAIQAKKDIVGAAETVYLIFSPQIMDLPIFSILEFILIIIIGFWQDISFWFTHLESIIRRQSKWNLQRRSQSNYINPHKRTCITSIKRLKRCLFLHGYKGIAK